jgi:hypothetical protein
MPLVEKNPRLLNYSRYNQQQKRKHHMTHKYQYDPIVLFAEMPAPIPEQYVASEAQRPALEVFLKNYHPANYHINSTGRPLNIYGKNEYKDFPEIGAC